jgi:hypothetical protein
MRVSSVYHHLIDPPRLMDLGPGVPNEAVRASLTALTPETLVPHHRDADMAAACLAGLWLLHDFLDESHRISQDLPSSTGSYWHAIMHRREPDPSNSKYWWKRVGPHPALAMLREQAPSLGYTFPHPAAFVDLCERVRGTGSADEDLAKRVQLLEWRLLFDWCWQKAIS